MQLHTHLKRHDMARLHQLSVKRVPSYILVCHYQHSELVHLRSNSPHHPRVADTVNLKRTPVGQRPLKHGVLDLEVVWEFQEDLLEHPRKSMAATDADTAMDHEGKFMLKNEVCSGN